MDKSEFYTKLVQQCTKVLSDCCGDFISVQANLAATIGTELKKKFGENYINWCGFYILRPVIITDKQTNNNETKSDNHNTNDNDKILVLSSFIGKPAVSLIRIGSGVCGTCILSKKAQLIPNVHEIPNHIACDSISNSELVIPIFQNNSTTELIGVLDLDSPTIDNFSQQDLQGLTEICALISNKCIMKSELYSFNALQPVLLSEEQWKSTEFASCSTSNPH